MGGFDRVGSASRGERRFDLPGGAKHLVMPSRGMEYTIVAGTPPTPTAT